MSLDVNKILMETLESSEAEAQTDSSQVDDEGNPITENTEGQTNQNAVVNEETDSEGLPVGIYASAISAGLGAISLRNRLRSVYEMSDEAKRKLKKAGKIGAGAAALGGTAYGAHKLMKGETQAGTGDTRYGVDVAKEKLQSAAGTAKDWVSGGKKEIEAGTGKSAK